MDYAIISIGEYARFIYEHRPTRDGRDSTAFEDLSPAVRKDWEDRAVEQVTKFLVTPEEYDAFVTRIFAEEEEDYRDRNGVPIVNGDILCINHADDEWYDVVVDRGGKLELASHDPKRAHASIRLRDAAAASEVVTECDQLELAYEQATKGIDYLSRADVYTDEERRVIKHALESEIILRDYARNTLSIVCGS